MKSRPVETSPQVYTKTAGALLLISIIAGGFGEIFVLSKLIVGGNANETAHNIMASGLLFRFGFASYLIEAICDVTLILIFYLLLKPVHKNIALLTVFFGLVSTITFAFAELFYIAAPMILAADYLKSFSPDQINSLALLSLKLYGYGAGVFMVFYGLATLLRGYLIFHSGYFPQFLGLLLILSGSCFLIRNFILVLAPSYVSDLLLLPMLISIITMSLWFLFKGVNVDKWREKIRLVEQAAVVNRLPI